MNELVEKQYAPLSSILKRIKSPWSLTIIIPILVAIFDLVNLLPVVQFAITAFLNTLPYVVFAVILIAYLKAAEAEASIARAFQGRENYMILLAALFGGLAPFCSCEVIPFIAGLLAVGAPLSEVSQSLLGVE